MKAFIQYAVYPAIGLFLGTLLLNFVTKQSKKTILNFLGISLLLIVIIRVLYVFVGNMNKVAKIPKDRPLLMDEVLSIVSFVVDCNVIIILTVIILFTLYRKFIEKHSKLN